MNGTTSTGAGSTNSGGSSAPPATPVSVTTSNEQAATLGQPYSQTLQATGGTEFAFEHRCDFRNTFCNRNLPMDGAGVMQLLKPMGITSTWDGKAWHMTTANTPDLSNVQAGSGNTGIYLNGTLVQMVNTIAQNDPSTNKPTTYMPIWYVMQLLKRVGLQSTWNGTTWTVTK